MLTATVARPQGIPTTQPNLINIYIEDVKLGMNAAHTAFEAGWPAAYAKAKSPYNYIALTSMTGPNQAWYVATYQNHGTWADAMKQEDSDTALSSALARLSKGDAQFINPVKLLEAWGFKISPNLQVQFEGSGGVKVDPNTNLITKA